MENAVLFVLGLLLLGAGLIEIGIIIPQHLEDEVNDQVLKNEKLIDGNNYYNKRFLNNTHDDAGDAYQYYYMYNYTNIPAILMGKTPIQAVEIGPLAFQKFYERFDISFFEDKVKSKWWTWYKYDQEKSYENLPLDEIMICGPDAVFSAVVASTRSNATIQYALASKFQQLAFRCRSAEEWLSGYDIVLPPPLGVKGHFGGYLQNQSQETAAAAGYSVWNTGIWDQYQLMNLLQYQGSQADTCYRTPQQIHASDNSQFPLGLTSDQTLYSYFPPLHRTIRWIYNSHSNVYGISTLKYIMDPSVFYNTSLNPDNADFYQNGPNGLLNLTACTPPINAWVSAPHFYGCDASLGAAFYPPITSNSTDISYLEIEPITGLPMSIQIRLQQSRYLEVPAGYPVPIKTLFPIFWSAASIQVTVSNANDLTDALYTTKDIADVIWWVGIVSGSFICFVALLIFIRVQVRHRRRKLLLKRSMRQSSRQRFLIDREAARSRRLTAN